MDKAIRNSPVKEALEMARRYGYEKGYAQGLKDAAKAAKEFFPLSVGEVELLIPAVRGAVSYTGFDGKDVEARRAGWTIGRALLDRMTKFAKKAAKRRA